MIEVDSHATPSASQIVTTQTGFQQVAPRYQVSKLLSFMPRVQSRSENSLNVALARRKLEVPRTEDFESLVVPLCSHEGSVRHFKTPDQGHEGVGVTLLAEARVSGPGQTPSLAPSFPERMGGAFFDKPLCDDLRFECAKSVSGSRLFALNNSNRGCASSGSGYRVGVLSSPSLERHIHLTIDRLERKKHPLTHAEKNKEEAVHGMHQWVCTSQDSRVLDNRASEKAQQPAKTKETFTLVKTGRCPKSYCYQILATDGTYVTAQGHWAFVVTASKPQTVQCLPEYGLGLGQHLESKQDQAFINPGDDVLAAGILSFHKGMLEWWRNDSEHNVPRFSLMLKNLAPLTHLLPRSKFFFSVEGISQKIQSAFLSCPPLAKPLPAELDNVLSYPLYQCPEKYRETLEKTRAAYETAHYLKVAFFHQLSMKNHKLLTPHVFELQTIHHLFELGKLDPVVGREFLSAYFGVLTLAIEYEWLDPVEMFLAVSQRFSNNADSLMEYCATFACLSSSMATSQAQFLYKLLKDEKIDRNILIKTFFGHFGYEYEKEFLDTNANMFQRIGRWLNNKKVINADGGYYIRLFKKNKRGLYKNVQLIYGILEKYKLLPTESVYMELLPSETQKRLEHSMKACSREVQSTIDEDVNLNRLIALTPQEVSRRLSRFSLAESLRIKLQLLDEKISKEHIEAEWKLMLDEQMIDIVRQWQNKIQPYKKYYLPEDKDSLQAALEKQRAWNEINSLPKVFFSCIFDQCKTSEEIFRWVRMQVKANYDSLAVFEKKNVDLQEEKRQQKIARKVKLRAQEKMNMIVNQAIEDRFEKWLEVALY